MAPCVRTTSLPWRPMLFLLGIACVSGLRPCELQRMHIASPSSRTSEGILPLIQQQKTRMAIPWDPSQAGADLSAGKPDANRQTRRPVAIHVSLLFLLCTAFSLLSDMLTKRILSVYARDGLAMTVTLFHFGVSALCGALVLPVQNHFKRRNRIADGLTSERSKGGTNLPPLRTLAAMIWPLAVCQAGGFLCTNLSLKFVPVSFSHTVKSCECLFTAVLSFLVLGQRLSRASYAALMPTAAGVALSAASEMQFSLAGFAAAMASNLCFAGRSVLSSRLLHVDDAPDALTLYWLLCCAAFIALTPSILLPQGPVRLLSSGASTMLVGSLCACGIAHFTYNALSFEILQLTSPVTHVVLHALRRVSVIAISSSITAHPLSALNWSGIALASAGVLGYAIGQLKK